MGWYQGGTAASPEVYTTRIALAGNTSGSGTIDGTFDLTPADVEFWENVDSNGHRIVVTAQDGVTEVTWQRNAWNYSARTATIEIDNLSLATTSAAIHFIYVYVGNADTGDLAGSFTAASAVTFRTTGMTPRDVLTIPETPSGTLAPAVSIQKTAAEQKTVWVDLQPYLARTYADPGYNGRDLWEEAAYVIVNVLSGGTNQPGMYDNGKVRLYRQAVRVYLQAGSSGTTYTVSVQVATATPLEPANATSAPTRILDLRFLLVVQDIDES